MLGNDKSGNGQNLSSIGGRILHGAVVIAMMSFLAKLASFVVESTLAAYLGTSWQSDAYYMVSGVKDLFYPMLSIGIWKVFLPLYKERIALGDMKAAGSLANKAITLFTGASVVVVALVILFAEAVVSIVAPGFEGETRSLCIHLVRISTACYVPIIASSVYASMLQCHGKFFGSQLRETASHLPVIIAAVLFYPRYGVDALAYGLVAGGVVRLVVELPFVDWGYHYRFDARFRDGDVKKMLRRLPSSLVSEGVVQLNTLVDKSMASTLPGGSVAALSYGQKLTNVFSGMLSSAITTALYPQMVELIALKRRADLSHLLSRIIRLFCVVMIPVSLACALFGRELVSVAFQRGSFGEDSVSVTSGVFALYSCGMLFAACNSVTDNVFYGYGDTATPMRAIMVTLASNTCGNIIFMRFWGVNGFALSTTLAGVASFGVRVVLLRDYVDLEWKTIITVVLKVLSAALVSCLAPRAIFWVVPTRSALTLFVSAVLGMSIYYPILRILGVSEIDDIIRLVMAKVRGRRI